MERAVNWLSGNPVSVPGTGHSMVSAFEEFGSQGLGWRAGGAGGGGGEALCPGITFVISNCHSKQ